MTTAPDPVMADTRQTSLEGVRLAALSEAAIAITSELSPDLVLQKIVDTARVLIGSRYAALGVSDEQGRIVQFLTSGLSPEERLAIGPLPRGLGLLGVLIHEGRPLRVERIADHPRSVGFPRNHPPMTTLLGVPIVARGEVLGDLYLTDRLDGRPFGAQDEQLALLLAGHAAVAIQNARLHARLQELAVHEERSRIMRDLHDGIIQSLFAIGLGVQYTLDLVEGSPREARERLEQTVQGLDRVMADVRRYVLDLEHTTRQPANSLETRLQRVVAEFQTSAPLVIQLSLAPDLTAIDVSNDTVEQLIQIGHEALANVVKHAHADAAAIRLEHTQTRLVLTVWDNGIGFDPTARRGSGQRGLGNMRSRARSLGGTVRIQSQPGQGTHVIVSVPLPRTIGPRHA